MSTVNSINIPRIAEFSLGNKYPFTYDYTIFWNREQLYRWYLRMSNAEPPTPKIRRQVPKKPRYERDPEE